MKDQWGTFGVCYNGSCIDNPIVIPSSKYCTENAPLPVVEEEPKSPGSPGSEVDSGEEKDKEEGAFKVLAANSLAMSALVLSL